MSTPGVRIACPACGMAMVERANKTTGGTFMGCSGYPDCTETQPVPAYLTLLRQGAPALPGFAAEDLSA